jgi:hypothetical protein
MFTPMAETKQTPVSDGEISKVTGWRLHVLIEAGYPFETAERIAESDVDLHRAVELVTQGCSPDVAEKILL